MTGAPRFVVGSHTWPVSRTPTEEEIVCAELDRGALAIHLAGTLHSGGVNETPRPFVSVEVRFTLGWLRQEENQYLSIPADHLERFPERVRALLGWQPQGPALGWVGGHDLPVEDR
jgi:ectoine hydroxylase-related dioxygenase (phytanoyl-CoA dioxygenase family)